MLEFRNIWIIKFASIIISINMDNTIQSHDKSTGNNKHQVISKVREAINDHHNDKKYTIFMFSFF